LSYNYVNYEFFHAFRSQQARILNFSNRYNYIIKLSWRIFWSWFFEVKKRNNIHLRCFRWWRSGRLFALMPKLSWWLSRLNVTMRDVRQQRCALSGLKLDNANRHQHQLCRRCKKVEEGIFTMARASESPRAPANYNKLQFIVVFVR